MSNRSDFPWAMVLLLVSCTTPSGQHHADTGDANDTPNPPGLQPGMLTAEFDARGTTAFATGAWVMLLTADEGEECVPSWMAPFLAPVNATFASSDTVPVPVEPVGVVFGMPSEIPTSDGPETYYTPPAFFLDDANKIAWFGGTWTFVEWGDERVEVDLAGGQTCVFDGLFADPETCVPDAGRIVYDNTGSDFSLGAEDLGYRGAPTVYVDPRSGSPLCHRITSTPDGGPSTSE